MPREKQYSLVSIEFTVDITQGRECQEVFAFDITIDANCRSVQINRSAAVGQWYILISDGKRRSKGRESFSDEVPPVAIVGSSKKTPDPLVDAIAGAASLWLLDAGPPGLKTRGGALAVRRSANTVAICLTACPAGRVPGMRFKAGS